MPTRAKISHDFEPSEQFGLRYSATGKLVKASDPEAWGKEAITYTNCLDIYDLCELLGMGMTPDEAEQEAAYLIENRKQFYNNHSYMKKKAIGEAFDGPVFPDDNLYRRSNGEKYTIRPDGSLESKAGKIIKEPRLEGFVHIFPRKVERTATFKEGRPRKDEAAPVLTLPKQDNPLVDGECKTRTPEEASRSAAKQREQARKEAAKTTEEEKQTVKEHYLGEFTDQELGEEINRRGILLVRETIHDATDDQLEAECARRGILALEKASDLELAKEMESRDGLFGRLTEHALKKATDKELAAEAQRRGIVTMAMSLEDEPTETLLKELDRRHTFEPEFPTKLSPLLTEKVEKKPEFFDYISQVLNTFDDKDLADELRRRGYTVTATKTVEI